MELTELRTGESAFRRSGPDAALSGASKSERRIGLRVQRPRRLPAPVADAEGQLLVDVHQTAEEIVVQAVVAGVKPEDLDVSITHEMVTIRGKRERHREVSNDNYFYQELYWGGFSRSVMLPQEVDVDGAEATIRSGMLTIRLPKLDKERIQKLRIKQE